MCVCLLHSHSLTLRCWLHRRRFRQYLRAADKSAQQPSAWQATGFFSPALRLCCTIVS